MRKLSIGLMAAGLAWLGSASYATADVVHLDDTIIQFSLCVGQDCNNGESFGFDTIRLKENNLRIHFDDTSTSASFPSNDWRIVINDSSNGGGNYFAIEDSTGGRQVFRVDAGAPANSLRVDSAGDVGIGTSNAVVELHVVDGNSPTLRLEQNGSSGFTPQTYDIAANEANFFIRDVTNGSALFFRSKPGAPEDSIFIAANGDIGLGTDSPSADLHIRDTGANNADLDIEANGNIWRLRVNQASGQLNIIDSDATRTPFRVGGTAQSNLIMIGLSDSTTDDADRVTITGELVTTGGGACTAAPCDATFQPDKFTVPAIEEHAEFMWTNSYLWGVGPTPEGAPINLPKKTTGILHELEVAHIYIEQLNTTIKELEGRLAKVEMSSAK